MMIDYNVRTDWPAHTPDWIKSLVSSLSKRQIPTAALPLIVAVEEIGDWVELASGVDAWAKKQNRDSLGIDLEQSIQTLGPSLRGLASTEITTLQRAFKTLVTSPPLVLRMPPGKRLVPAWMDVLDATTALLDALTTDDAVRANWDDLVTIAQDRTSNRQQYRPMVDLLVVQLRRRGLDGDRALSTLVSIVAYGREPGDIPIGEKATPFETRLETARTFVGTPVEMTSVVVWLGYKGRITTPLSAGQVRFYDAHWTVPNAAPEGLVFEHKAELWSIVQYGNHFRVAERVDEESDVDTLVRVDLGERSPAGAKERASAIADVIIDVSINRAGGIRPRLAEWTLVVGGDPSSSGMQATDDRTGFPDDYYGARLASEAIEGHGSGIAEALARQELPRFLAAALEVQTTLERPFSRDMALRTPSEADVTSVVPLADRVVQNIAAHVGMTPGELFTALREAWPHARWLTDLRRAVGLCLASGNRADPYAELAREWYSETPERPWILLIADRAADLLTLCRVEHERAWIERMFVSVEDYASYAALLSEYRDEAATLEARRGRQRNALVHGNPTRFAVVQSIREYAEFLSRGALYRALESFVDDTDAAAAVTARTEEFIAMQAGQDAASYWRSRTTRD